MRPALVATLFAALLAALLTVPAGPASAAPAAVARASTGLVVEVGRARSDEDAPVGVLLTDPNGVPVAGASVLLERRVGGVVATAGRRGHRRDRAGRERAADGTRPGRQRRARVVRR